MAVRMVNMECEGCHYALKPTDVECPRCGRAIVVTSFNSIYSQDLPTLNKLSRTLDKELREGVSPELAPNMKFTIAGCYLKLKLYDKALQRFEEAIEENFDNPETYFYAAVCQLKGKKACLTPLPALRKALEYIDAANSIEPRGVFHYFAAYIKNDFFAKKFLRIEPDWRQEFQMAVDNNLSPHDADMLFNILGAPCPDALRFPG